MNTTRDIQHIKQATTLSMNNKTYHNKNLMPRIVLLREAPHKVQTKPVPIYVDFAGVEQSGTVVDRLMQQSAEPPNQSWVFCMPPHPCRCRGGAACFFVRLIGDPGGRTSRHSSHYVVGGPVKRNKTPAQGAQQGFFPSERIPWRPIRKTFPP